MTDWLFLPLSGAANHHIEPWAYWHARCMVLAWAVLLPLGALAARFFKVTPRQDWPAVLDNRTWWIAHRALQWSGVTVMAVGLCLAFDRARGSDAVAIVHAWAGWCVAALACLQIAGGLARGSKGGPTDRTIRGDHYDMTRWRVSFERTHKGLGWLSVALALSVMTLGLVSADAPWWMAMALALWWLTLAVAFVVLQRRGRCIDTYQAIWGPDLSHPGNLRPPVGWGVHRPHRSRRTTG